MGWGMLPFRAPRSAWAAIRPGTAACDPGSCAGSDCTELTGPPRRDGTRVTTQWSDENRVPCRRKRWSQVFCKRPFTIG
jgi:hypothetical protein